MRTPRRPIMLAALLAALGLAIAATHLQQRQGGAMEFRLTSAAFANNQPIPALHSCDGAGTSPALRWEGVPGGTRSLALIMHDPDAPSGDFTHWLLWDVPPTITEIPSGNYAEAQFPLGGRQGTNSFGKLGFGAPCPPPGPPHHYIFTLYALNTPQLPLAAGASREQVEAALRGKVVAEAGLVGTYKREQR